MAKQPRVVNKDPFIWYVIDAEGNKRAVMGVRFVDDYPTLISSCKGEPGIFLVRNAASTPGAAGGDPSVHEGWAAYVWDDKLTATTAGFRKIAEQESVDGPWGIDERILRMLVKRTDYDTDMSAVTEKLNSHDESIRQIDENIIGINESINTLNAAKHTHANQELLDKIGVNNGRITIDGEAPVTGGFFYDNVVDGKIYWKDPTDPEAEAIEAPSSLELAGWFANTSLAIPGTNLEVVEPNGEISTFKFTKGEGEEGITAIFVDRKFTTITVETLPAVASAAKALYIPTVDDGTHPAWHYYKVVDGAWVDVTEEGKGTVLSLDGGMITAAQIDLNPLSSAVKMIITVALPSSSVPRVDPADGKTYRHQKTYLVRKYGRYPTSIEDGRVIAEFTDTPAEPIEDIVSIYAEQPYYCLFSFATSGAMYKVSGMSKAMPRVLEWKDIVSMTPRDLTKYVKVGDTIYLPEHPKYGYIACEVVACNSVECLLASRDVLKVMRFGDTNDFGTSDVKAWLDKLFLTFSKYRVTTDCYASEDKTYFTYNEGTDEFNALTVAAGDMLPRNTKVYEINGDTPVGVISSIDLPSSSMIASMTTAKNLPKVKVGEGIAWWMKDTSGSKVATNKNPEGIEPTEEAGVVPVFKCTAA